MTKKRLGELLREEVKKPSDQEGQPSPTDENTPPETESPSKTGANHRPKRKNPTKADLETTVTELQEELQAAHQRESSLQQQVADLQAHLQEQKTSAQKLQTELESANKLHPELEEAKELANKLQAELEEAKGVILQLSETNSRTSQKINSTKPENKDSRTHLKKIPHHSVKPRSSSSQVTRVSNTDIGWVD
ncbi:MAG: hypothetical protein BRC44_13370 [Cyanobacteria bacterium QS_4_48_99]|nr:MAG: hypothetical protein BRC44_13370 [Cyanobacteria bacterium QS_4_48_99]